MSSEIEDFVIEYIMNLLENEKYIDAQALLTLLKTADLDPIFFYNLEERVADYMADIIFEEEDWLEYEEDRSIFAELIINILYRT